MSLSANSALNIFKSSGVVSLMFVSAPMAKWTVSPSSTSMLHLATAFVIPLYSALRWAFASFLIGNAWGVCVMAS